MRQVRVLIIGLLVAVALAVTLHAQNYVWSSINGIPYGPGLILTGQILAPSGSASAPSYSFSGDTNTGFYSTVADAIEVSVGGTRVGAYGSTYFVLYGPGARFYFNDDVTLYRVGVATLAVTDASTGAGKLLTSRSVEPVTSTKTPGVQEGWEVYTNEGDADGATITLPTAAAGLTYTTCIQAAQTLTITANTGDTIRLASGVTAAAGSVSSNVVGSCVTLVAINSTEWFATSIVGSWSY